MKDTPDQPAMSEAEIIHARDEIMRRRTRRSSPQNDTRRYDKRPMIDCIVDDLRLARELSEEAW